MGIWGIFLSGILFFVSAIGEAAGTCSICLEEVTPKRSLIRKLSFGSSSRKKPSGWQCAHTFHPKCVAECLATGNDRCPVCRIGLDGSRPSPPRSAPPWQASGPGSWQPEPSSTSFSDESSYLEQPGTEAWQESGFGPLGQPSSLPHFSHDYSIAQLLYQDDLNNYQSRLQPFEYETYDPHLRSGTQAWQESGFGPWRQPSSLSPFSHESSFAEQPYRGEFHGQYTQGIPQFGYEPHIRIRTHGFAGAYPPPRQPVLYLRNSGTNWSEQNQNIMVYFSIVLFIIALCKMCYDG